MIYPPHHGPWEKYVDEQAKPGAPALRDSGYPVWSIIGYLRLCRGDKERMLADYGESLTAEELEAALAYYWAYPEGIDRKLWEIAN